MPQMIFVNLPVKDLDASVAFFTALGFSFNPQFTDETATCMVISDTIFAMLLTHEKFLSFSPRPIADTRQAVEVLTCLSRDSRADVDAMVKAALAAGGTTYKEPQDYGFMYGHGFQDLDGHVWELMWMDPAAVQG
ncbi:putative lactoylglutathione lyase [Bosea sp. BE125]|uniref:VOC family protein n=1 Tax=Bosea sp. BE125 TaxID=2817909 RepID=UPI00285FE854|nr:VOC family protein [Bosea sp. BE125]MDR6874568.1 putative lactoylglutathione lyase [Bosea sp. BE125]